MTTPTDAVHTLHDGKFLKLQRDGRWEYVSRQRASGAGFIVAVTDARELVLVEQYRVPLHQRVIELPAGIIGDGETTEGESAETSALRELEEETGFVGTSTRALCHGPVAAGMTDEIGYFVQVFGLRRASEGGGVEGENITVHVVPLAEVETWLEQQAARGVLIDPRVFIALYFAGRNAS
ncbi:ADP-ribose pyrophosphatase [Panacagrimonas perspica]|uniref:ADP-ribose pyrophosphatase n=1 Tax=Panacagrimonas perspica TaxID=381431 RepID=A0A4R7PBL6_9GAMM|nr:NUDIX hydrolase [Panacagrimonas perspica]TDU30999.1 ADP-ribose pyrophosphatase [Panacagrimonas perspica]THD01852.1 DNA mismatch repair protein MutT [Panacagrimonas perspica]